ncbi:MAG: hypothetical protein DRI34_09030 [Deltaproteobacteria bacterium]|nr:MAG: hypothetical protein DRI34_09030 [Deltaproteobacteria bacterium]
MPRLELSRQHSLAPEQARQKVEQIGQQLASKHGLEGRWSGADTYEFKRTGVKGQVKLTAQQVLVQVDLSLVLSPLKGKIEQKLREGLEREFA